MIDQKNPRIFSILRAAAAEGESRHSLPAAQDSPPTETPTSGDPLAALALRTIHTLIHDLPESSRESLGLFVGTTDGSLRVDQEFDRSRREAQGRFASPAAFRQTLPSAIAAEISVKLLIRGPLLTLCAGDASAALALRRGAAWLDHARLNFALVGALQLPLPSDNMPTPRPQVAFLLLSAPGQNTGKFRAIGDLHLQKFTQPHLGATPDHSLSRLMQWIQSPTPLDLPCGLHLRPFLPTK